jgi:hypothetical protein
MEKAYITKLFFDNAVQFVRLAQDAHNDGRVEDEVRCSMGAHSMCAVALESIINEVAETVLASAWKQAEMSNTIFKWIVVSKFLNGEPFAAGAEPLQTVSELQGERNKLVHPKAFDLGTENIVRNKDGRVRREVPEEYRLMDGDPVYVGFGVLLAKYNHSSACRAAIRTYSAFKELKKRSPTEALKWVEVLNAQHPWLGNRA